MGVRLKDCVLPRRVSSSSMVSTSVGDYPETYSGAETSTRPTPVALDNVYAGSHNRPQMERDTPSPSGADDRLSGKVDHQGEANARGESLESSRKIDPSSPEFLELSRATLVEFHDAFGMPTELVDLNVDEFTGRRLRTSPWSAVIKIASFHEDAIVHPGIMQLVENNLVGRHPKVRLEDGVLTACFQMANGDYDDRILAARFAFTLALLIDGLPHRVSVSRFEDATAQSEEPPADTPR
jgi:hypothetical protein